MAHGDHSTALAEIKADVLASIGETNREHTRDPIVGMHNHTCNSIIAAMVLLHGQYTEADVLRPTDDLQKKLSDLENFDSHVGKFTATLRQLVQAGTPVQGHADYNHFKAMLSSFPAFEKHVGDYVTANPDLAARTHNGLATCVRLHLASVKAKSGRNPFAGSAQEDKLTKKVAALERQIAALSAAHPPHQVRNAQVHPPPGRRAPVTSLMTPPGFFYCYHHGHNRTHGWANGAHHADACRHMAAAHNAPRFTTAMENAKTVNVVAGGNQNVQKVPSAGIQPPKWCPPSCGWQRRRPPFFPFQAHPSAVLHLRQRHPRPQPGRCQPSHRTRRT
jgi:hypothetical protein